MHPKQKIYLSGRGIVYFIQPVELLGTSRYKVGCSYEPTLKRPMRGYKKGSRYLIIMECDDPRKLEKLLLTEFHRKFTCIAGNEYFEGDENDMKQEFQKVVRLFETKPSSDINTMPLALEDDLENLFKKINSFSFKPSQKLN